MSSSSSWTWSCLGRAVTAKFLHHCTCSWRQHGIKTTRTSLHEEKRCKTGRHQSHHSNSVPQPFSLWAERRCLTLSFGWLVIRFHLENKQGVAMSCFIFFLTTKNILILFCLFNMITEKKRSLMTHFSLQGHWVCPPQGRRFASSSSPYVHISNTFKTHTHIGKNTHTHTALSLSPTPVALETAEMGTPSLHTPSRMCAWLGKLRELHRHLAAKTEERRTIF